MCSAKRVLPGIFLLYVVARVREPSRFAYAIRHTMFQACVRKKVAEGQTFVRVEPEPEIVRDGENARGWSNTTVGMSYHIV